ncbi:Endothelin-converting enzyme 1 [Hypsibius exemplaris]|uniref:Endothelin-converting enzyme 1 n=1 Tax=Hypsibius exemplaris TaxID=2072580 RepID=A0A9X6RK37_HYPEX|nr:Endothelin-converting enzyme 1 [Hypsibius exemplaris]
MEGAGWILLTVMSSIALVEGGYPWPTPDWHKFYKKTTTSVAPNNTSGRSPSGVLAEREMCASEACKLAGEKIVAAINQSADPCHDFFNYACGNWIAARVIPDNETEVSKFKDLIEKMKLVVQGMLDEEKSSMFQSEVKIKSIYKQCKNQEEIEELGAKPLLTLLDEELGGWPILDPNWNASNFDLFSALTKVRINGDEPFFSISVDQDLGLPAENVIFVTEPDSFATKDVLQSEAGKMLTESYLTYLFNATSILLREIGDQRDVTAVAADLTDIMELGRFISLSGQTAVQKRDLSELKNKTTLGANQAATFTRSAFFRRFSDFLRGTFQPVGLADHITSQSPIVLRYTPFFDRMDEKLLELETLNDAGKRRLANYIGWRVITGNIQYLSKNYRDTFEEHQQRIQGQKVKKEKTAAERCATDVGGALPLALSAIYVRDHVPADLKAKASMMVNDIKLGFRELLVDAEWMDNTTFLAAEKKLNSMLSFVAYPDVLVKNISAIDAEYENASVGATYFATLQELSKAKNFKNLKKLVKKNVRDDPIEDALDITGVNAYNMVFKNFIVVLAAILQSPFYETNNPEYLNYGGIGFVIGHETTHGFDDQGASFDEEGLMRSWWTQSTTLSYDIRKKTFVDQYNAYNKSMGHVNGELTLGENIADNGGLKAAYRAYFNYFQKRLSKPELLLPGFPKATNEQLFFLSAGQVWCGTKRPEAQRLSL